MTFKVRETLRIDRNDSFNHVFELSELQVARNLSMARIVQRGS